MELQKVVFFINTTTYDTETQIRYTCKHVEMNKIMYKIPRYLESYVQFWDAASNFLLLVNTTNIKI